MNYQHADLQALAEAGLDQGLTFGEISWEIRQEAGFPPLRETIYLTIQALKAAEYAGHSSAGPLLKAWLERTQFKVGVFTP